MHGIIDIKDGDARPALVRVLQALLGSGLVDAVLAPLRHPAGDAVAPALVADPARLADADPLAPVLPVNAARLLSLLTQRTPRPRVAAVLRNCEIRALVELVKLQQASMEGLLLVGVECTGTYEVADYPHFVAGETAGLALRPACLMCEHPAPELAALTIWQFGTAGVSGAEEARDPGGAGRPVAVTPAPMAAPSAALHFEIAEDRPDVWQAVAPLCRPAAAGDEAMMAQHAAAMAARVAAAIAVRERELAGMAERCASPRGLADFFSRCIRCHNCMTNCPICYCKTCFFRTEVFDHDPMQYLAWAQRKGAARLPTDTTLFHLTRLNHMSTSCVGCGLCTSACPAGIPVGLAFRATAQRTQALFGYEAGRSLDETPPVKTFNVDELRHMGER